jgi:hypothetical protein
MISKYEKLYNLGKIDYLYEGCDYATNGGGVSTFVLASPSST